MKNLNKVTLLTRLAVTYQQQGLGDAFVYYYGHVSLIEVKFYNGKWDNDQEPVKFNVYLNSELYNDEIYNACLEFLTSAIESKTAVV